MDWKERLKDLRENISTKSVFPFKFVIYFVLAIYEHNIGQVTITETIRPILVLLTGTSLVYLGLYKFIGDRKAGIITFTGLFFFLTYGVFVDILIAGKSFEILGIELARRRYLLLLEGVIGLGITYTILTKDINLEKIVKMLNFFTVILLATVLIGILTQAPSNSTGEIQSNLTIEGEADERPNIYYIVPDRYPSNELLQEEFNFNNSNFTQSLMHKGFYVTNSSHANYPSGSFLSLTSALNMQHLKELGVKPEHSQKDFQAVLENNEFQRFLRTQGYSYKHIGFDYRPTQSNKHADINVNNYLDFGIITITPFELLSHKITMLQPVYLQWRSLSGHGYNSEIDNIESLNKEKTQNPKFSFLHSKLPHTPFRFNENGERLQKGDLSYEEKFVHQVKASNKLIERKIDELLAKDNDSIIMIVSDQGPKGMTWKESGTENASYTSSAFIAVRAPEASKDFYPKMTPINTIRIVLNNYFDTGLELVTDDVYLKENKSSMTFKKINEYIGR